ncbi:MAG: hypothetical protein AAF333_05100 [Planctomycetota bacterium]
MTMSPSSPTLPYPAETQPPPALDHASTREAVPPPRRGLSRSRWMGAMAWVGLTAVVVLQWLPGALEWLGVNERAEWVEVFLRVQGAQAWALPVLIVSASVAGWRYVREDHAGPWPSSRVVCVVLSFSLLGAMLVSRAM